METHCTGPQGRRILGLEEDSSLLVLGGTRSQEILDTLEQSKTNVHAILQESGKEHRKGITSFVSLSPRGFRENMESWKRHDLRLV